MNIHHANPETLNSLFETNRQIRINDTGSSLFGGFTGFKRGKAKLEPPPSGSSARIIPPITQTKLRIINKNPTLFLRLHDRLRERHVRHSKSLQVLELQAFLSEMMIVEAREEIKSHVLVIADTKTKWFLRSSLRYVKKSLRPSEVTSDDSTVETSESESKGSLDGSSSTLSSPKAKSPNLFNVKTKSSSPRVVLI